MKNPKFHQLLRKRGMDVNQLAYFIDSLPTHVSQVLNNIPGRGGHTRRKLFKWLLPEEIAALGWTEEYKRWLSSRVPMASENAVSST